MGYVKLDDIAREAGVSKAVVSYVLRGKHKEYRISPATCRRVREITERLNYIPHVSASGFRQGGTRMLGLIVQDIAYSFYSELAKGVSDEAQKYRYNVIFCSSYEDCEREKKLVHSLMGQRVDGLILLPLNPSGADYLESIWEMEVPFVLFQKTMPDNPYFSATFDDFHGTRLATDHLLGLGHREVAFCGTCNSIEMVQIIERAREEGFRQAFLDRGLDPADGRVFRFHDFEHEVMEEEVRRFLQRPDRPTALACISDELAACMLLTAQSLGLQVPRQLSIIGNDDRDICQYLRPQLSSVHFPRYEMGTLLADIILEQIRAKAEKEEIKVRHELIRPELVLRESCAPPPGGGGAPKPAAASARRRHSAKEAQEPQA